MPPIKKERLVRFYVLNDCKQVLILGLELLCDNEVIVDYGKGELKLEGKIHQFIKESVETNIDDHLCREIIFKCREKTNFKQILEKYEEINETFPCQKCTKTD